jgi:tetratricopeptide (TPR) repeat protein
MRVILVHISGILLLMALSLKATGQSMLKDEQIKETILQALNYTYNFEFDKADETIEEIKTAYPTHPAANFLKALNLYWRMYYFNSFKENSGEYLKYLDAALQQAQARISKNNKDPEGIFFSLTIYSSLAQYHSQMKETMKAVTCAKKTYEYIKTGFNLKDVFNEFYFTTGLYDFYVEQFPETNPVFKPFMVFFSPGGKEKGIKELEIAASEALFSRTEANHYLANIYLRYMNTPENAINYTTLLYNLYPNNLYFLSRHIESLIGTGQYTEAERLSLPLRNSGKKYFEMASYVFLGIINEKGKKRPEHAKAFYLRAVNMAPEINSPSKDYVSFAYAGLARIAESRGERDKAKAYYQRALELAEYTSVIEEAEKYLKKGK